MTLVESDVRIHLCHGPTKVDGGFECPCCKQVLPEHHFLMSTCGDCTFDMNPSCDNCVRRGVPFHEFQHGKTMHRLRAVTEKGAPWVSACGISVPSDKVGNAIYVIFKYCKRCWKDDDVQA